MNNLFIEKYRPSKFEDVVGQEIIVERVKAMTEQENIPHMLFSGPAGVGKTTLSLVLSFFSGSIASSCNLLLLHSTRLKLL